MNDINSVHIKHRERLRKKFTLYGLDVFEHHEILELILFYVIPRKDTNKLAHDLLNEFGSIHNVLEAPLSLLEKIEGVGKSTACFIKLLLDIVRVYLESKNFSISSYTSREELNERMVSKFIGRYKEFVAVILTDSKNRIIYEGIINQGSYNSIEINARKIMELIMLYNASGILLAHNHPSGFAIPSRDDIQTTRQLQKVFKTINCTFIDHIIVADNDYVSLRDCEFEGILE